MDRGRSDAADHPDHPGLRRHPRAAAPGAHHPELFARWVGPRSLQTRIEEWDARTGGCRRYVATPERVEFGFHGTIHEVRPDRILQTFTFDGEPDGVALQTLRFEDLGDGRTRLHPQSLVDSFEGREAPAPVQGWRARDIVQHPTGWLPALLAGGAGIALSTGVEVDQDPAGAWLAHAAAVQALSDDPGTADRLLQNPYIGQLPVDQAINRPHTTDVFPAHLGPGPGHRSGRPAGPAALRRPAGRHGADRRAAPIVRAVRRPRAGRAGRRSAGPADRVHRAIPVVDRHIARLIDPGPTDGQDQSASTIIAVAGGRRLQAAAGPRAPEQRRPD